VKSESVERYPEIAKKMYGRNNALEKYKVLSETIKRRDPKVR